MDTKIRVPMWCLKWMKVQWFEVRSKTDYEPALSNTPCKQIQPMSKVKSLDGPRVRGISPVRKVYGRKDLLKSQVLSSEWNTERIREDASCDSEDGEDDELPCMIGESAGDCVWRGSRRSVGSSFDRQVAANLKERFVIFKEDWVGGRARVTINEQRAVTRLNSNQLVEILRLVGCKNVIS